MKTTVALPLPVTFVSPVVEPNVSVPSPAERVTWSGTPLASISPTVIALVPERTSGVLALVVSELTGMVIVGGRLTAVTVT